MAIEKVHNYKSYSLPQREFVEFCTKLFDAFNEFSLKYPHLMSIFPLFLFDGGW